MKFVGNSLEVIDWVSIVEDLKRQPKRIRGTNQEDDIHHNPKVQALREIWQEAGYENNHAIGWVDYDVSGEVVNKFADWLNVTPIGGWITSVLPGYCVPWHPDYNDEEEELLKHGEILRFSCHICQPSWGQVLVLEDHVFHMEAQGNTYQWNDWQDWHGGMNMGLTPKFLFNFMGYAK